MTKKYFIKNRYTGLYVKFEEEYTHNVPLELATPFDTLDEANGGYAYVTNAYIFYKITKEEFEPLTTAQKSFFMHQLNLQVELGLLTPPNMRPRLHGTYYRLDMRTAFLTILKWRSNHKDIQGLDTEKLDYALKLLSNDNDQSLRKAVKKTLYGDTSYDAFFTDKFKAHTEAIETIHELSLIISNETERERKLGNKAIMFELDAILFTNEPRDYPTYMTVEKVTYHKNRPVTQGG